LEYGVQIEEGGKLRSANYRGMCIIPVSHTLALEHVQYVKISTVDISGLGKRLGPAIAFLNVLDRAIESK
jgi:hypothetical protein